MPRKLGFIVSLALIIASGSFGISAADNRAWDDQTPVWQVLHELGEPLPPHYPDAMDNESIKRGREIITQGYTQGLDGKRSKLQSKYFKCTNCHNLRREDPDLRHSNPEKRLDYITKNDIPFLQGTTFWGIVNRESWFNDYYREKYGKIVEKANNDLHHAIQVCSSYCSKGRELNAWELQSVLSYLWTLQMRLGDLGLAPADWKRLHQSGSKATAELVKWIKGFYLHAAPATYSAPPPDRTTGFKYSGQIEKGRDIFVRGCLHCHRVKGVTPKVVFDNSEATFITLAKNIDGKSRSSIYQAIRDGINRNWFRPYMPNYTLERMSDKQIEDVRAFIEFQAGKRSLPEKQQ